MRFSNNYEKRKKQEKGKNHFFEFIKIHDPRNQSYITYEYDILLFMGILKNACNL